MSITKFPLSMKNISLIALTIAVTACDPYATVTAPVPTVTTAPSAIPTSTNSGSATASALTHQAELDFEQLVARVKSQDPDLDFTELRMAFARTSQYDPYGPQYRQLRDEMVA